MLTIDKLKTETEKAKISIAEQEHNENIRIQAEKKAKNQEEADKLLKKAKKLFKEKALEAAQKGEEYLEVCSGYGEASSELYHTITEYFEKQGYKVNYGGHKETQDGPGLYWFNVVWVY